MSVFGEASIEAARVAIEAAVGHRLAFNVAAYGTAWTGEDGDTSFIVADAPKVALAAAEGAVDREALTERAAAAIALENGYGRVYDMARREATAVVAALFPAEGNLP